MTASSVITNQEQFLDEVINKILPSTEKASFLVWFFYFSWFQQIYKNLVDKKVSILIGMDVEQTIRDLKFKFTAPSGVSTKETINNFKDLVNKTDIFENWESLEAMEIFIKKIQDWSLEIKQTLNPNHAKIYLFQHADIFSQWWIFPGTVITWSGNLTYSWLHGQWEFNIVLRDPEWFNSTLSYFDQIRENESVPLTTWWEQDAVVKMLKNETRLKLSEPYYCYMRLLSEYFKENQDISYPSDITDSHFQDLEYQTDAIKKALHIIDEHNGVIVADVVGLGKSIIWSTILHNLKEKAIIIVPPHLVDQWNDYRESFDFDAEVYSSWLIKKALEKDMESIHKVKVILVDEVHKYRNADTIDYWFLHQLCQWKKVVLLTATPFNNRPDDIFNLIKLFQIPNKPTIYTKKWLLADFTELQKEYDELRKNKKIEEVDDFQSNEQMRDVAHKIRQLIWPVVVRRSRVDLNTITAYKKDLEKQGYEFSKVEDPKELKFDLGELNDLYVSTLDRLVEVDGEGKAIKFKWARYNVLGYLANPEKYEEKIENTLGYNFMLLVWRQRNMPFFMKRLLVSRFESSIYAFKETLKSLIWSINTVQGYIKELHGIPVIKKWVLPDIEDILDSADSFEYDEYWNQKSVDILEKREWFLIKEEDIKPEFFKDMDSDKEFLETLFDERETVDNDPKLDVFIEKLYELQKENKDRKIVVFSQYTATVDYLEKNLKSKFRILKVTWSTKTEQLKKNIKLNFDAWVEISNQKNDYDILLWTDAISEWYNLHRAWIIVNYDIPYNPTRVIQRIGRINRINKKVFDTLYIYNYFPSLVGEQHTSIKKISTLKIKMMATILWIDVKTLTEDEEIGSFYKKEMEKDIGDEAEISWDTPYFNDFKNAKIEDPKLLEKISTIPERTKLQRNIKKNKKWVLLFAKKWTNLLFQFYDNNENKPISISIEETFELFKAEKDEQPTDVSKDFYKAYNMLKDDIKNWAKIQKLNMKEAEALDNVKKMFGITKDPYFNRLVTVIEYRSLPLYYMKIIRKITERNFETEVKKIKEIISESYLKKIINAVNNYDEESQDLIITQEFNS